MQTALLCAGGGSRGINSSGFLLAIRDLGIDYKEIHGSSAGTLVSLLYHAGDYDSLIEMWLKIKPEHVFKDRGLLDLAFCYNRQYIRDSSPLRKLIYENIHFESLQNNQRDFWINTTDLTNGVAYSREVKSFKTKDELVDFAYASASPPIYFPPVRFEDKELCDSAVVNDYSIIDAIHNGCDTLILLLPTKPVRKQETKTILQLLSKIFNLSTQTYMDREIKSITKVNKLVDLIQKLVESGCNSLVLQDEKLPRDIKIVIITPEKDPQFGLLDFTYKGVDRRQMIQDSYLRAKEVLSRELWP